MKPLGAIMASKLNFYYVVCNDILIIKFYKFLMKFSKYNNVGVGGMRIQGYVQIGRG